MNIVITGLSEEAKNKTQNRPAAEHKCARYNEISLNQPYCIIIYFISLICEVMWKSQNHWTYIIFKFPCTCEENMKPYLHQSPAAYNNPPCAKNKQTRQILHNAWTRTIKRRNPRCGCQSYCVDLLADSDWTCVESWGGSNCWLSAVSLKDTNVRAAKCAADEGADRVGCTNVCVCKSSHFVLQLHEWAKCAKYTRLSCS